MKYQESLEKRLAAGSKLTKMSEGIFQSQAPKLGFLSALTATLLLFSSCQATVITRGAALPTSSTSTPTGVVESGTTGSPATAANILGGLEAWDSTGAKVTGSMPSRGNWNMNSSTFPGVGYYSGLTSTITTTNVCSGISIFGAAGVAVCESGTTSSPAGAANILSGLEAWSATGTKITGSMTNQGALDASATFPGAGYYSGTLSNLPLSSQIASGTTILGVSGTAGNSFGFYTASNASRQVNTTQIMEYCLVRAGVTEKGRISKIGFRSA